MLVFLCIFLYENSNNQATGREPGPEPVLGPKQKRDRDRDRDQSSGQEMTGLGTGPGPGPGPGPGLETFSAH